MTKEKIIDYFKDINVAYNECTRYDSLKHMLDELEGPCEDCVSKQAVAEILLKYAHSEVGKRFAEFLVSQINALPPVTSQPKTGHWIERIERDDWNDYEEVWYECNQCHLVSGRASNYCPNCGAKMQEVEE